MPDFSTVNLRPDRRLGGASLRIDRRFYSRKLKDYRVVRGGRRAGHANSRYIIHSRDIILFSVKKGQSE